MKIQKIEDIKINSKVMNIYGRNGSGKTSFVATLPKPLVIVDINEKGLSSIPDDMRKDIIVINIESVEDMSELVQHLKNKTLNEAVGVEVKSIAFDTLTQFKEMFEFWADENKAKFLSEKGKFDKFKVYRELNRISSLLLKCVKANDLTTAFIFQEKEVTDDMGNVEGNAINATSGMKNVFLSGADITVRTAIVTKKEDNKKVNHFAMSLINGENDDIKVRTKKRGDEEYKKIIVNPTWDLLDKEIN